MYNLNKRILAIIFVMIGLVSVLGLMPILAQSNEIILTVAIEEWQQDAFGDAIFEAFEQAHHGVKVITVVIPQDEQFFGSPSTVDEVPDFMANATNLAGKADLLRIDSYAGNRTLSLAGVFLDITPLLNADADANLDDFYPAMLQSFQWDGATWGLPLRGDVQVIVYNQTRFDELGLSYPNETWTLADYMQIGRELTVYDASGVVELPGFYGFDSAVFLQAVYGRSLADPSTMPAQPLFTDPELVQIVEQWAAYRADTDPESFSFDFQAIPMKIQGTFFLNPNIGFGNSDAVWKGSLLPNGAAALQVEGYGISGGTQYPELSYELLQYMTNNPEIVYAFFGLNPARQSMVGNVPGDTPAIFADPDPETQALTEQALARAMPTNERQFFTYIDMTISAINHDGQAVEVALQELQDNISAAYTALVEQRNNTVISVATPIPTPVLTANEVSITFGIQPLFLPLPNRQEWLDAIDEFVAQDAQVGQIVFDTEYAQLSERAETQDCFYLRNNPVPSGDMSLLLSIQPFLAADANFDPNDIVTGALEQMTRDGQVWGMPMSLDPVLLWYQEGAFNDAGVPLPNNTWTVFEFIDAIQQIHANTGEPAFSSQSFGSTYMMLLFAAFGGDIIDQSESLLKTNLTDPNNIEAIRQVLDLSKNGYMEYSELGAFSVFSQGGERPIIEAPLSQNSWRVEMRREGFEDPYRTVLFPSGTNHTPVSYSLGGGFISANTVAPEACYRFLSFISQKVELLSGMPAKRSQFDTAASLILDSDDLVTMYRAFDAALQAPDVVVVQDVFSNEFAEPAAGISNFLAVNWMNMAFDEYVLEGVQLETALTDAQQKINDYHTCIAGIEPMDRPLTDLTDEESAAYFQDFQDCALAVDPDMNRLFGGGGGGGGGGG